MKPIMALFATIGLMGLWGCGIFRVDPSAYDRACAEDRECTLVSSLCLNAGCQCASVALNRSGAQEFTADRDQSCVGAIPSGDECICPVLEPRCVEAQCEVFRCDESGCEVVLPPVG